MLRETTIITVCVECGSDPVHHGHTFIGAAMETLMRPILIIGGAIGQRFSRVVSRVEDFIGIIVADLSTRFGWATLVEKPDEETRLLAKVLWEEAQVRGIAMREFRLFGLARNLFLAELPDGRRLAFEGVPTPLRGADRVWWIDDKAAMKKRFKELGFPVARGGSAFSLSGARRIFRSIAPPAIVKPHTGSGSRHTTLHINDERELERAFLVARELSPFAIVEEELVGAVYRATVIDGKCAGVLRRDQPYVIGDGKRTVRELVAEANKHPARGGPYFHPIRINEVASIELAWQGLTETDIPENGRRVTLHQKVNWGTGGTTKDVTDETHPDNVKLFEDVARALRTTIVGIDFIIQDPARSWKETPRCGIIECNSLPFFDNHHLPFEGQPRNVAAAIWEMMGA